MYMFMGMDDEDFETTCLNKETMKLWMKEEAKDDFMQNLYIDMVLRESWLKHHQSKLDDDINRALDRKDKREFQKLARRRARLERYFGT